MEYTPVTDGKIAAVVTYLEMRSRPEPCPVAAPQGIEVRRVLQPGLDWYRDLFRRVGQDWLWFSRLRMNVAFYIKSGFVPYARGMEISDDPRLSGGVPETVAPHVALIHLRKRGAAGIKL